MHSPASLLLRAGFDNLNQSAGEELGFRGSLIKGVVNRIPFEKVVKAIDFQPRDTSRIRIRIDAISGCPRPGEWLDDNFGLQHRIQTVKQIGLFYEFNCETSGASSAGFFAISTAADEPITLATYEAIAA